MAAHPPGDPRRHHGALHVGRTRSSTATNDDGEAGDNFDPKDAETVATIKELLDTRVRPQVAQDGGDITFNGFRDGVVYLHMRGACAGCPSSTATLRHGIENLLKHFCPDVHGSAGGLSGCCRSHPLNVEPRRAAASRMRGTNFSACSSGTRASGAEMAMPPTTCPFSVVTGTATHTTPSMNS